MVVLKSKGSITNALDVKHTEPLNPVHGQNWQDGNLIKRWDAYQKKWISEDLTGPPGETGSNALNGYLTNESIVLFADDKGVIPDYSLAKGDFKVFDGATEVSSEVEFSRVSQTGCVASISNNGAYQVTSMSADVGSVIYQAIYKEATIKKIVMVVKNKQGDPGAAGKPTGVVESSTEPSANQRYEGMLWKDTNTGITNVWRSGVWSIYTLKADNLVVDNLAALSGIMGTLSAGHISGSTIVSNFNDIDIGGLGQHVTKNVKASGTATMSDGKFRIEFVVTDDAGVAEYKNSYGYVEAGVTGFHARWAKSNGANLAVIQVGLNAQFTSYSTGLNGQLIGGSLSPSDLRKIEATQLVAASGFSPYATTGTAQPTARRNGTQITLAGAFKNNTATELNTTNQIIGYVPDWARPEQAYNVNVRGSMYNDFMLQVYPNGEITASRYSSGASPVPVAVGAWLNISCSYPAKE